MRISVVINCLFLLVIFLFFQYAIGDESQKNHTLYIKSSYKDLLTRKKRFLTFTEGSSIVFALGVTKGLQVTSPNNVVFTFETPAYYNLPNTIKDWLPPKRTTLKPATTPAKPPPPPDSIVFGPGHDFDHDHHDDHFINFDDSHHDAESWMPPSGWNGDIVKTLSSFDAAPPNRRTWKQKDSGGGYNKSNRRMWTEAPSWKDVLVHPTKVFKNAKPVGDSIYYDTFAGPNALPKPTRINPYLRTMRSIINHEEEEKDHEFNIEDHEDWEYYRAHKDRRDIYKVLESFKIFNGIRMQACILRTICEMRHFLPSKGESLFTDILRIVFSFPVHKDAKDKYTSAMRTDRDECLTLYSDDCPFSILTILLFGKRTI